MADLTRRHVDLLDQALDDVRHAALRGLNHPDTQAWLELAKADLQRACKELGIDLPPDLQPPEEPDDQ